MTLPQLRKLQASYKVLCQALNNLRNKKKHNAIDLQRIEELKMMRRICWNRMKDLREQTMTPQSFRAWKRFLKGNRINI